MLQETKSFQAKRVLREAQTFNWNESTLEHMSIVHQELKECVIEVAAQNIIQDQYFLAELKSYRLVFACRIESHQHLDGE